jgi:hypothetical protein
MKNINLKSLFKKDAKKMLAGLSLAWPVHFVRDWRIIVICFALGLALLSALAWRVYLSNKIAAGFIGSKIENSEIIIKTVDKKRLEADLLILESKQTDYLKQKANQQKMVDPSL